MVQRLDNTTPAHPRAPFTRNASRRRPYHNHTRLLLEALEDRSVPTVATWLGAGDGSSWADPANWSNATVPNGGVNVVIPSGFTVHHADDYGTTTLTSLVSDGVLDFDGHLELVGGVSQVNAAFNFDGDLDLESGASLELTGGGALSGTFATEAGSELDLSHGTFTAADGTVFEGDGKATLAAAVVAQNPVLNIPAGTVQTRTIFTLGRGGEITGAGTFQVSEWALGQGILNWWGGSMTGAGVTRSIRSRT